LDLKGKGFSIGFDYRGESLNPTVVESEDIVTKPNVLDSEDGLQLMKFGCHGLRTAELKPASRDGLGAPVATEGTAPTGNDVCGEVAVRCSPCSSIRLHLDQLTSDGR
jgi:hypothetical protein